ncbi:MAG TPA: type II secretion system protein GspM [Allosphingosinicella sp.]|jgi:general secretion pathway protein M
MTENLTLWWLERSRREQILLGVMFGLAALLIAWLLVLRPLSDALDSAMARHDTAIIALAEARARAPRGPIVSPVAAPAMPVDSQLGRAAAEAGFADARVASRGPNRASVAIAAARPQALFAWVARLEAQGLAVERLRAQANPDRTLSAEASFRARGR